MSKSNEIFKDVKGFEGHYQISNLGRVKSLARKGNLKEKILKGSTIASGYLTVLLYKDGKTKGKYVHQLVAEAFLNHIPNGKTSTSTVVNHINFNRADNRLENLELTTMRENTNRKHLKSSSDAVGVSWSKHANKWQSGITINGKVVYLGV